MSLRYPEALQIAFVDNDDHMLRILIKNLVNLGLRIPKPNETKYDKPDANLTRLASYDEGEKFIKKYGHALFALILDYQLEVGNHAPKTGLDFYNNHRDDLPKSVYLLSSFEKDQIQKLPKTIEYVSKSNIPKFASTLVNTIRTNLTAARKSAQPQSE